MHTKCKQKSILWALGECNNEYIEKLITKEYTKGELGMQVSSRAWHIRLVRLLNDDYRPKNLCKHFWTTLLVMLVLPPLGVLMVGIGLVLGVILIAHFPIYGTRGIQKFLNDDSTIRPWWVRSNKEPKIAKPKKHREPNIFIEWVKAKKQRVCPVLEVVEVKESESNPNHPG